MQREGKRKPLKKNIAFIEKKMRMAERAAINKRIRRKQGLRGNLDIAFGSFGAVAGGVCGMGVASGIGAVVGGSTGFAAGNFISSKSKKKQQDLHKNLKVTPIEKK